MNGRATAENALKGKITRIPTLDRTLTKEGCAADAKAVGDALSAVEAASNKVDRAGDIMYGELSMSHNKITNVAEPTESKDAANKEYVDSSVRGADNASKEYVDGAIAAVNEALDELEAATKEYADTMLPLAGGTMAGSVEMAGNAITGLATPGADSDAATKAYADLMLPKKGGTMSGAIAMGSNKITGLATPTANTDAATKAYADKMLPKAGGTMTGAVKVKGIVLTSGTDYGTSLPSAGTAGKLFFVKV